MEASTDQDHILIEARVSATSFMIFPNTKLIENDLLLYSSLTYRYLSDYVADDVMTTYAEVARCQLPIQTGRILHDI